MPTLKKHNPKAKPLKQQGASGVKEEAKSVGRPTAMTESTVKKLEEAYMLGCTDSEACLYANITKPTLYDYCKLNPEFLSRKEALKEHPRLKVKVNLNRFLDEKDRDITKFYAERKMKDEFSLKDTDQSGAMDTLAEALLKKLLGEK